MPAPEDKDKMDAKSGEDAGFLASHQTREATSWMPWIIAATVVIVGLGILVVAGGRSTPDSALGTGMASADPYAPKLAISGIQMSEATSFSGAKVTYIDGQITNLYAMRNPDKLTGITIPRAISR